MNLESTLVRTEKGAQEIETREHKLGNRMRALLLAINGKQTGGELARKFERLGDVPAMLRELLRAGFIEPETQFDDIRREVASVIYRALGPDGNAITREVEDCQSLSELRRYLAARRRVFEAALDKGRAALLWTKLSDIVG